LSALPSKRDARAGGGWRRLTRAAIAPLLAISAYWQVATNANAPSLDDETSEDVRRAMGGQLTALPTIRTRWYQRTLEDAKYKAAHGDMSLAGQLCIAMDDDGVLRGVMSTRTGGLVRLPKKFRAAKDAQDMADALQAGGEQARSVFDEMCPPQELEGMMGDFVKLGVAVGELVPVAGREYPVLVRRLPEFLVYRWSENQWYFRTLINLIPITPGDGQWVLLTAGREAPWLGGLWRSLGRAFITKDHARNHRDAWEAKLANAARIAVTPQGSTAEQRVSWFRQVAAWGVNSVFSLMPGWDVRLLESNGRGYETFVTTINEQDKEIIMAISGQTVTADGGVGFANADVFDSIKADLIQRDGDALAHCVNTQIIPAWVVNTYGEERLADCPTVAWDTTPPLDQKAVADSLASAAKAITDLTTALAPFKLQPDVRALCTKFGVPIEAKTTDEMAQPAATTKTLLDDAEDDGAKAATFARRLRSVQAQSRLRIAA
jgi:hypothetical protein